MIFSLRRLCEAFLCGCSFLSAHPAYAQHRLLSWIRVASWYAQVFAGVSPRRRIPRWQLDVKLPRLFKTPAKVFYIFGQEYDEMLEFVDLALRPGETFVDIGANFGIYSLLASRKVGARGSVHAIEPTPSLCILLRENARANLLKNIDVIQAAFGDHAGAAFLNLHADSGRSSLRDMASEVVGRIEVAVKTLDEAIPDRQSIAMIKMDVEGYEPHVLSGGRQRIQRDHPVILFENNPGALKEAGSSTFALVGMLAELDYSIYLYTGGHSLVETTPTGFGNFVALHNNSLSERFGSWTVSRLV